MANIVFIFRTKAFQVPPVYAAILSLRPPVSTHEAALETPSFSDGQKLILSRGKGDSSCQGTRDPSCLKTRYRTSPVGRPGTRQGHMGPVLSERKGPVLSEDKRQVLSGGRGTFFVRDKGHAPFGDKKPVLVWEESLVTALVDRNLYTCPFRITTVRPASDCLVGVTGTRSVLPLHVGLPRPVSGLLPRLSPVPERGLQQQTGSFRTPFFPSL